MKRLNETLEVLGMNESEITEIAEDCEVTVYEIEPTVNGTIKVGCGYSDPANIYIEIDPFTDVRSEIVNKFDELREEFGELCE